MDKTRQIHNFFWINAVLLIRSLSKGELFAIKKKREAITFLSVAKFEELLPMFEKNLKPPYHSLQFPVYSYFAVNAALFL
ncbi:MAG: hypothetical protein EAZ32_12175 [Cytophagia bacterium]|nr:MAG: hypothetical protein EAZ46_06865 [Runella sp.]TAG19262.1 MAG: hypothetical protein EAZ38_12815 [Cytophagales bacterium]TAG38516.1 MAG: hypothetical protein EAZ32_12175 [Cytophagia bacterium]TAG51381.1 MAG: hypothetical protein EAZ29_09780 [Runella slithyformis]TAG80129.1 MAG: hypothetical protein EAZ22_10225 [Cytophagales bacterium]